MKISISTASLIDHEETMQDSPTIEYASIYSVFGSVLGLSSVFGNSSPKTAAAATVGSDGNNIGNNGGNNDRHVGFGAPSSVSNEEARFHAANP